MTRRMLVGAAFGLACWGADVAAQTEAPPLDDVASVAWMAGCWSSGGAEEQWMAPAGGLMVGMSRTVRDGLARGHEFLVLRVVEGRIVYWAYPSGQAPTSFPVVSLTDAEVVFANPEHDFPQKIRYRRAAPDRLVASVFGGVDDERPAFELDYRRVPCPGSPGADGEVRTGQGRYVTIWRKQADGSLKVAIDLGNPTDPVPGG